MDTNAMRAELARKYSTQFAARLTDAQVVATYKRLKAKNKI